MIAVFFGGRSCEHDISIITGLQALSACKQKCAPIYIDGAGTWWTGSGFDSVNAVRNNRFKGKVVHLRPDGCLYSKNKRLFKIDAALLCMHGVLGEDGALQGMLAMCGVPYTGSNILASALGMNKLASKRAFTDAGLNVVPYLAISRAEYEKDFSSALKKLVKDVGFPVIVKPCNLGSSIGISVANTQTELFKSLRVAFEWDDVVIAEKALDDFTEVNCAVLGDESDAATVDDVIVSETEQPVGWKSFLTFADKYSGDVKQMRHKIPADVGDELNGKIKDLAIQAFRAVGASGVARVDFMIKDGEVFVNEINTIPGSLAEPLFRGDMRFSAVIDKLIELAVKRKKRFDSLRRVYTPTEPIASK